MQDAKYIVLGLILMVAGGAVLLALDFGGGNLIYGAWGLIALGGLLVVGGVHRYLGANSAGADATEIYKSDTIARLVMQSTMTTAMADGPLDDQEIDMIVTACESVVHEPLDKDSIRRLAKLVEGRGDEILHEIHSEGRLLNPDGRRAIIDACMLVLKADDKVDERQMAAVTAIARQLDYSEEEAQAMVAAAMGDAERH